MLTQVSSIKVAPQLVLAIMNVIFWCQNM